MAATPARQRERALALLSRSGIARLSELNQIGITSATVSRLAREGAIVRLARGLYQLADAPLDSNHSLAEVAKLAPRGVICLVSALAFHDLTDRIPAFTWVALDRRAWRPRFVRPHARFVRFSPELHKAGIGIHVIEGVRVPIYTPAKTVADLFRYRRTVGLNVAIAGLRETLRQRKATPADIGRSAIEGRVWKVVQPYMEALIIDD